MRQRVRAAETDLSVTGSFLYGAAGTRPILEGAEVEHFFVAHVLQHLAGQRRAAASGPLLRLSLYTPRMASTTASGASNWMYSELFGTKICFALDERPSQRACALL